MLRRSRGGRITGTPERPCLSHGADHQPNLNKVLTAVNMITISVACDSEDISTLSVNIATRQLSCASLSSGSALCLSSLSPFFLARFLFHALLPVCLHACVSLSVLFSLPGSVALYSSVSLSLLTLSFSISVYIPFLLSLFPSFPSFFPPSIPLLSLGVFPLPKVRRKLVSP